MNLRQYYYRDVEEPGWEFSRVEFGKINLLVGDTATGKTRLLNTMFNLGRFAAMKEAMRGYWEVVLEHAGRSYTWHLKTERKDEEESARVVEDNIWLHEGDQLVPLVQRNADRFVFADKDMPKLSPEETSITLLKEEEAIRPLYEAFSSIQRRRFFHDALSKISELHPMPISVLESLRKSRDLGMLFKMELNLSARLFVLSTYFNETYNQIIQQYKKVFPFIREASIVDLSELKPNIAVMGQVPVFSVRERQSSNWIPVTELSSGMQKVLLILTDIHILPEGAIYFIDEYENSLGLGAIDFFPEFMLDLEKEVQFFITSHHPYIINEIPPSNWYVFHRKGMHVTIKHGPELQERFGKSRQQAFTQLINDPFFVEGVE